MRHLCFFLILGISLSFHLKATIVGNPAEPTFLKAGIFTDKKRAVTLRFSYYFENIYKTKFRDEIINDEAINNVTDTINPPSSILQLKTNGAIITLNIKRYLEVYGLVGQSRLKIEEKEVDSDSTFSTQNNFSWGIGVKLTAFKYKGFSIGGDGKYFQTRQVADFLIANKYPALITTDDFSFIYEESQGSIAFSYEIDMFTPYIGGTYLRASITPSPKKGVILLAFDPEYPREFECNNSHNVNRWGLLVGTSIVSGEKIAINLESRMFDQNSVNISAEICF